MERNLNDNISPSKQKHAYLIMIHEISSSLECCLKLLDDERNDFYIHIDKKAQEVDREQIKQWLTKSHITFVKSRKIYWGNVNMAKSEFTLLREATKQRYAYYHLLSGADMPIKSKQYIFDFFSQNAGKEFIHFATEQYQHDIVDRFAKYHFFTKQLGRKWDKKIWRRAEKYSMGIQRRLHVNRLQPGLSYYGGAQWFSITDDFAHYCLEQERVYRKRIRFTHIPDEWMMQTLVMNSPYKDNLYLKGTTGEYSGCQRYIDWNRGKPYVFQSSDFDELMQADALFARKFDERTDANIIKKLYECLSK